MPTQTVTRPDDLRAFRVRLEEIETMLRDPVALAEEICALLIHPSPAPATRGVLQSPLPSSSEEESERIQEVRARMAALEAKFSDPVFLAARLHEVLYRAAEVSA